MVQPRSVAVTAILAAVAAGIFVISLGPRPPAWYPPCLFHSATGFHCPGCGSARAVHALLHGEWLRAIHDNALLFLLAPAVAVYLCAILREAIRGNRWNLALRGNYAWAVLVAVIVFWIARNLPFPPGPWLAPFPNTSAATSDR